MIQWVLRYKDGSLLHNASGGVWTFGTRHAARRVAFIYVQIHTLEDPPPTPYRMVLDLVWQPPD